VRSKFCEKAEWCVCDVKRDDDGARGIRAENPFVNSCDM